MEEDQAEQDLQDAAGENLRRQQRRVARGERKPAKDDQPGERLVATVPQPWLRKDNAPSTKAAATTRVKRSGRLNAVDEPRKAHAERPAPAPIIVVSRRRAVLVS